MKFLVLGAGWMGRAVSYDLAQNEEVEEIRLADIDYEKAKQVCSWINNPKIKPFSLDVNEKKQVMEIMKGVDGAIGCISYKYNHLLTLAAIKTGIHFNDLGGNNEVVQKQFSLDKQAKNAGITIIPDCGLAPGVVSILIAEGTSRFDTLNEIHIRVGGLPQNPKPPLNYSLLFSVQGLINEYVELADVIRDGKLAKVEALTELEDIIFPPPFGTMEAFQTSGGSSTLPTTFLGKVRELDYKTIRYKGHCEKIKAMLDLGFRSEETIAIGNCFISPRQFFEKLLTIKLTDEEAKDVTLVRVIITGYVQKKRKKLTFQIIDHYDEKKKMTSMMRMTAFPASIIAQMMVKGIITQKGVITQEFNVPSKIMIEQLRKRNISIQEKMEEIK